MSNGTYTVKPERLAKAKALLARTIPEMAADDIAGALVEAGLGECWIEDTFTEQARLSFTDLQTVAAAAVLLAAQEGADIDAIEILTG